MLNFEPVTLDKREMMERYFFAYGEGSCQHSFVSSFCLAGKYGDQVCEREGYLYILRSLRCSEGERVYLFPQGNTEDRQALRRAITEVLNDAHGYGASVRFETLTARAKDLALSLFPDVFTVTENRDCAEYVYSVDRLVNLPGHGLASRRKKIHHFFNEYGDRFQIVPIGEEHIPAIRAFQRQWLEARTSELSQPSEKGAMPFAGEAKQVPLWEKGAMLLAAQLAQEDAGIQVALDHFFELGLSGVVAVLDGRVCGYEYGAPLSEDYCDAMAQKGDRILPEIYRVLDWEFLRLCFPGYTWVNWEEDLGVESLRAMKTRYNPDFMIEKFILCEGHRHE